MTIPLLLAAFFAAPVPTPVTMERTVFLMGTRARIVTVAPDREQARGAAEAAFGTLRAAEERLSTWTDHSELSAVNRSPVGEVLPISPRLSEDLARAGACVEETGGAFDPALGTLVRVWDLRGDGKIPDESEIRTARRNAGWKYLELRPERIVRHRQVVIEEGGFGKGAALDRALRAAAAAGATGVEIDLGGQIARLGAGSRARPIVVAHPRHRQTPLLEITLAENEVSAATTGNGQRGLSVEGRPVGHLLDPRTGRPAEDFGSLTVIAPSAFRADCLSTGLFVLGPKEAVVRAEELPGIEAVALSVTEDRTAVEITSGLRERVRPVEGSMSVKAGVLEGPQPDEGNEERFTWTVERSPSPMTTFVGVPAPAEER